MCRECRNSSLVRDQFHVPIGIRPGSISSLARCGCNRKQISILTDGPGSAEDVRPTYKNIVGDNACIRPLFSVDPITAIDGQGPSRTVPENVYAPRFCHVTVRSCRHGGHVSSYLMLLLYSFTSPPTTHITVPQLYRLLFFYLGNTFFFCLLIE
jgi:hypothetical protein